GCASGQFCRSHPAGNESVESTGSEHLDAGGAAVVGKVGAASHQRGGYFGDGSQRQRFLCGGATTRAQTQGRNPGEPSRWQSRQNLLCDRSSGCDQDRAHLLERAFPGGVATGCKNAGAPGSLFSAYQAVVKEGMRLKQQIKS